MIEATGWGGEGTGKVKSWVIYRREREGINEEGRREGHTSRG